MEKWQTMRDKFHELYKQKASDVPVRFSKSGLGRGSDFRWCGGMLLYGLTDAQCCFDALN